MSAGTHRETGVETASLITRQTIGDNGTTTRTTTHHAKVEGGEAGCGVRFWFVLLRRVLQ